MARTIMRYEIGESPLHFNKGVPIIVTLPENPVIMHVGLRHGKACIWVLADMEKDVVQYEFRVLFTGDHLPIQSVYMASIEQDGEVYHLVFMGSVSMGATGLVLQGKVKK